VPTLGLTGSGSRIRVSQRDCSTTTHSPSGERHPPASRRANVGRLARSLARVEMEAGKETNEARVLWGTGRSVVLFTERVARDRPSQMDGSQPFGPH
jgi:hypothetical protein